MLSLNCGHLFKIYASYIISECRSVKIINIPWFLVPHFYLFPVQSYNPLKLRAFKEWLFCKTNEKQTRLQNQYFRECHYVHTLWAERYTCLLVKKIAFMSSTEMIIPFRIFLRLRHEKNVFCGIIFCDVGILWKNAEFIFAIPMF